MIGRPARRTLLWALVTPLMGAATGVVLTILLGATVLSIEPTGPRDRAVPTIGPRPDPLRIVVLGTSLSSASRYQWPDQLGVALAAELERPVDVERVTQPGQTSEWGTQQIERVIAFDPDVVLIEFGVNDADLRSWTTTERSVAQHEQIIEALRSTGRRPAIVLLTMNPAHGPRAWSRPFLSRYYATYVELAHRHDTGMVDLYPRWIASPDWKADIKDGVHPSDASASRVIVPPLVDALATAAAAPA